MLLADNYTVIRVAATQQTSVVFEHTSTYERMIQKWYTLSQWYTMVAPSMSLTGSQSLSITEGSVEQTARESNTNLSVSFLNNK